MTRRARVALWSFGLVMASLAVTAFAVASLSRTEWGRERIRRLVVSRVTSMLAGRGRISLGQFAGGLDGHFTADSVVLFDNAGQIVATVSRIEADAGIPGLLTGRIRLRWLLLVRPYVLIEQRDTVWNISRLTAPRGGIAAPVRSSKVIALDSAEVRDGRLVLLTPDSLRSLPPERREFSHLQLVLGPTSIMSPVVPGGAAEVRRLSAEIDRPPVSLRDAAGRVGWRHDSLMLAFAHLRLPGTHATAHGSVAWGQPGGTRLDLRVHADTLALADVAWTSPLVPKHGEGTADVHMRNAAGSPRDIEYALSHLDVRATRSRVTGEFAVTPGRNAAVTGLALDLQPLDLDLVREILGAGVPKPAWQGALSGTVRGRGGPLDAIRIDEARVTFDDRRVPIARSHLVLEGVFDARSGPGALRGMRVEVVDLDLHTLGAVARSADSVHGVLTGHLTLDGPVNDVRFSALSLEHVDGDLARSRISGEGRLATDQATRWLDASLVLDTIAVATLARNRTTLPLRGGLRGTLELHATRDTMSFDARLRAGPGIGTFRGALLLDSSRTWLQGTTEFHAVDPHLFLARKNIPALVLGGTGTVLVEGDSRDVDGHVDLSLDTTSVIGVSPVLLGRLRAGLDSTGFHVDTAEIIATDWRLSARGRLARTGATHDSLHFNVAFDSLAPLRALVLDSAGAAIVDSLGGAAGARGVLVGSLDTLALATDFSVSAARWNGVTVRLATGRADLARLPRAATGVVTLTSERVAAAGFVATTVQARAAVRDGNEARITLDASSGDTLRTRAVALVQQRADTTRVALDSLDLVLGQGAWHLDRPTRLVLADNRIALDSTSLRSSGGATIALRATLPSSGAVDGALHVRDLGREEVAFTGILSPDLEGRARADIQLSGTRDAPRFSFIGGLDSLSVGGRRVASFTSKGSYDAKLAHVELRGTREGREWLDVAAELPVDLALRGAPIRLLDNPLSIRIHADSAALEGFGAVLPQVEALGGTLWADDTVTGTWKRKYWSGFVRVRDGAFDLPKLGFLGRRLEGRLALRGDSVLIVEPLRMVDSDDPRDFITLTGALVLEPSGWQVDLRSNSRNFKLIDDPRLATIDATWNVHLTGFLRQPFLEGDVILPSATFVIGETRRIRPVKLAGASDEAQLPFGMPIIKALHVTLGSDVRLKSRDANVGLTGEVDVAGELSNPYVAGEVQANRGTYRVDLGVLKRTFRVDSGLVRVAGTRQMPASLDIWTSYVVRSAERDDRTIVAHLFGASDAPRLELSSAESGSAVAQSEIISYLLFGSPTFALTGTRQGTVSTATAVLAPSLGGVLEGVLGSFLPFLSSLQVATVAGSGPQNLNPLEGVLNSFAFTAGRQFGSDTFLSLSGGRCGGSRLSSTQSAPSWFGVAAEYRPKRQVGAVVSVDPGSSPCSRVGRFADVYQFGFDLFKNWRF